jgi:cation/acetate symporter
LSFDARIVGARSDALPDRVYAASAAGRLDLCGARAANVAEARKACAALPGARLARKDVAPKSAYFFSAYADLLGLGASIRGLAAAAVVVVGLALAAASFLGLATVLGHDLLFRLRGFPVLASARIAATRALLMAGAAAGAVLAARGGVDPKILFGGALAVSGCLVWPLLALAAVPRAGSRDAALAVAVAAVVCGAMHFLAAPRGVALGAWGLPVVLAALSGASAGVVSSLLRADAPGGRVVMGRDLHGEAEAP